MKLRKFIAMLLCIVLLLNTLPLTALAALIDNPPEYNQEILSQLEELVGSEDEAERYYAILQQYGLLDEDGSAIESWEIYMDGEEVTLDDILGVLEEPDCDLDKYVIVDGSAITLGELQTILEIEEYIAYLRETYFSGGEWTQAHLDSLDNLMEQINNGGIMMYSARSSAITWPSGVSHDARVSISQNGTTFTAELTGAIEGQEVSFNWQALSGSQPVSGGGTVTMTADASGTATATFNVTVDAVSTEGTNPVRSTANLVYYVKCDNIKNALFDGDRDALTVKCTTNKTVTTMPGAFTVSGTGTLNSGSYTPYTHTFTAEQKNAIDWGIINGVVLSQNAYNTDKTSTALGKITGGCVNEQAFPNTYGEIVLHNFQYLYNTHSLFCTYSVEYSAESGSKSITGGNYSWKYTGTTDSLEWKQYKIKGLQTDSITKLFTYNSSPAAVNSFTASQMGDSITLRGTRTYLIEMDVHYESPDYIDESGIYMCRTCRFNSYTEKNTVENAFAVTAAFSDQKGPEVQSVSAPTATYYPGQVVPVTVTFSEPVNAASAKVKFNGTGTEYTAVEGSGYSNVLTFAYTVQEADNTTLSISSVTATDTGNKTLSGYNPGGDTGAGQQIFGVSLSTPIKSRAITDVTAEISRIGADDALNVNISISSNEKLTAWMGSEQDGDGNLYAGGLTVSIDGGTTMHNLYFKGTNFSDGLYADIPLEMNTGTDSVTYVAEIFIDNALTIGKYATATQTPVVFITKDDLSASINIGNYTFENPSEPVFYIQGVDLGLTASINIGTGFTFGNTSKTAAYGTTDAETADFVWESTNPSVANIDKDGRITPTGMKGSTQIILTARNGGVEGKAVTVTATYAVEGDKKDTLNFAAGLTPFLMIPNDGIETTDGNDAIVYWSSNLCDKNGEIPTVFTVTVTRGGEPVYETTVSGTALSPAASAVIPGEYLPYDYDSGNNTLTITVSATYGGVEYKDTAVLGMEALPAEVKLEKLNSYYILDTENTLNIAWSVAHLDRAVGVDQENIFRFRITRNDEDIPTNVVLSLENGSDSGIFTLPIEDITASANDPTSYRDVYTVTIQAKNGTDSTWSYDSFLLYVYDEDALKIMVDGEDKGDGITMSNVNAISQMTQDEILALKRDIHLKNIISVNYGEYAWTEVADQIMWASNDSGVASVNYQQGTLYENIERFTYTSYRPTTELGLSGLTDGNAVVSAIHKLTGMEDTLNVTVETLKDKLYLFQCYPQAVTTLTYTNGKGETKTAISDSTGAAAIYEESGIASDVYCEADVGGITYLGTFYLSELETGEGDWTKLERYPCNNLNLRRAAYAYVYLKTPEDQPYTGSITFRGGVYVNGEYKENALFDFTGSTVDKPGNTDNTVSLGADGKLTVTMDQTQWNLPGGAIRAGDEVEYVFQIESAGTEYYPILYTIDATANEDAYVGSGSAVLPFRANAYTGEHPFIAAQAGKYSNYGSVSNLIGHKGNVGPSDSLPEASVTTVVMWWGEDMTDMSPSLQFVLKNNKPVASKDGQYTLENSVYPFSDISMTQYTVRLNKDSLSGLLESGEGSVLYLNYYKDGETLYHHEEMTFKLCNMLGVGKVEESNDIEDIIQNMGSFAGTDAKDADKDFGDEFVGIALNLISTDSYSTGDSKLFSIQISPTSDPTKFLGFIEVNLGTEGDKDQVTGVYADTDSSGKQDWDYAPGLDELMVLTTKKTPSEYIMGKSNDRDRASQNKGMRDINYSFGGYAESLIYYDVESSSWKIQILSGGFTAGGGVSYTWNWNTMVGPVPFTASLSIGGNGQVSMDALTVAYLDSNQNAKLGNDFLTELRIYLYLRFFAGVGIDYSIIAFKLGIFGQIDLDMRFQWLNRPYLEDGGENIADGGTDPVMHGQNFKIHGTIGLEFVMRFLFFSYEKILWSKTFTLLDTSTNEWNEIQSNWTKNQAALQQAISGLLNDGGMSVYRMNGQQMYSLNLAPTMEDRSYLESDDFYRQWGNFGISTFALDSSNALANLQSSAYPYANPVVSDDGQLVGYLSDENSTDVTMTRAAYGVMNGGSYDDCGVIDNGGYGDSQLAISGTEDFAVAAWTRQTVNLNKDAGSVLTDADQMIMMDSTEVYAAVYTGSGWTTVQLSDNSAPDLAPVVASGGNRAVVAWRSVSTSGEDGNVTNFDQKDCIVYKIYDGTGWSELKTLYNGTSGAVKGIVAAMMDDGTAAVAYTLDADRDDSTLGDKEIYYAVIDNTLGEVTRNVRATNDGYLDENPQLTAVTFPSDNGNEHFVLGWYTEQNVSKDSGNVLNAGETGTGNTTTSDIRLIDFTSEGVPGQLLPDSISQVADSSEVTITSNFRFVKNAQSINDLSILWVERAEGTLEALDGDGTSEEPTDTTDLSGLETEKDVLKGVKFYTYGQHGELIRFTGAIDVAEMYDGTLIDHFDAYVSDASANEIKAVILGTTYGAGGIDGTVTKTVTLDNAAGTQAEVTVPTQTTSMYTATETYADRITVPAVLADYETVRKGAVTQIQFTVKNDGIHAINQLTFTVGNDVTVYDGLNLLPGTSIQLYADYTVPEDRVIDPEYVVTAEFGNNGATGAAQTMESQGLRRSLLNEARGTVYLNLPDIEITKTEIVEEVDGKRTIRVLLNNDSDADLNGSGCTVKIGFYTDASHETPVDGLDPITITSDSDFAMIDEGGYSTQVIFDVKSYIEKAGLTEIPESGITVYIMTQVLDENSEVQGELVSSNNFDSVVCENLKVRTGKDSIVTSTLTNDGSGSTVTVNVQNTRLSETITGNVVVTLLDAEGKVLGVQQSYTGNDGNNGLIELKGEERKTLSFTFTGDEYKDAVSAEVVYSDLIIGADNANLVSLSFSNIPGITLGSFAEDANTPGVYRASVSADDLTSTAVIAVAESSLAKIKLSDTDEGSNAVSQTVVLQPGEVQDIAITVINGIDSKTYILTVQNNGEPIINDPTGTPESGESTQYSASTFYAADAAIISLNAAASPEFGYALTYQWYSCDADGGNTKPLQGETSSTLTIPNTTNVGVYYYRCKVTRQMLDGTTTDYWSSVASVQINKATDNSVTLEGTTVVFDNQSHGLTGVTAAKANSRLHYSTDGGQTWSEIAPVFTAVGVHTVWVYATNPNYEDTAVVTADVVIQERTGILFKLETYPIADLYPGYPTEVKALYPNADILSDALIADMAGNRNISKKDIEVYGVKLLFSMDDGATWIEATADNFPSAGMTVTLPYPEGTNRYNYNFILKQFVTDPLNTDKTAGDIKTLDITLDQSGIRFTADCLSALVLGWNRRPTIVITSADVFVEKADHGTVQSSHDRAIYGNKVTITVVPDNGYQLDSITIIDKNGNRISYTDNGNGTYTFQMPRTDVTVTAVFKAIIPDTCDGTAADNCPSLAFTDLDTTQWYHLNVDYVLNKGMMNGMGGGIFAPNGNLSRAMLVTILWRLEGEPIQETSADFFDVAAGQWYTDAIQWASANGIVNGYGNGLFGPNDDITREQLATILYRYEQYKGGGFVGAWMFRMDYVDLAEVSDWAYEAMCWMTMNGIVNGRPGKVLDPKGTATRAEAAAMLNRYCEKEENE